MITHTTTAHPRSRRQRNFKTRFRENLIMLLVFISIALWVLAIAL